MSEFLSNEEMESVLERYVQNDIAIKELQEQNALLKSYFKGATDEFQPGQTVLYNNKYYIKVSSNTRIDDKLARRKLAGSKYNRIAKTVVDPVLARRVLTESELSEITKTYDNRIEIGII